MLTRKHFVKLASILNEVRDFEIAETNFYNLVEDICVWCKKENDNFDKGKFLIAIYKDKE